MTTPFGGSLELQGDATDLSSARQALTDNVKTSHASPSHTPSSHALPKKKRGRPRKAIPPDALVAARTATKEAVSVVPVKESGDEKKSMKRQPAGRGRKKNVSTTDFFEDDYFDLDGHDGESSFFEEELTTLDEFEKLVETLPEMGAKSHTRLDRPAETPPPLPRRKKVARRRQIDPATCERDYSADELEFMNALSEYKRTSGRMFPTCSEILEVLKSLGYEKPEPGEVDW